MNKKILGLTGALIVVALGIVLSERFFTNKPDPRLGKPLAEATDVVGIDTITISKGGQSLKMVVDANNVWRLGDAVSGFQADASKISQLIDEITRTNVQVVVSTSKEPSSEFGLADATNLVLQKTGKDVLNLKLAGTRQGGGQFVAFGDDPKIYLINQGLPANASESGWELKNLVNIAANQVKKVTFNPAPSLKKKGVVLSREKVEDPIKVEKLGSGAKESSSIRSHESVLSNVTFAERLPLDNADYKKAMATPTSVKVDLFDGRTYDIKVGSTGGEAKKYFIAIAASKGENTSESDAKDLETLTSLMGTHVFEIPSHVAAKFEKGFEDMIEKKGS